MNCIYIHGKRFVDLIMSGQKTIETRNSGTLNRFLYQTVGIILTGCGKPQLIGTVRLAGVMILDRPAFRAFQDQHHVLPGSRYDIHGRFKIGYTLESPVRFDKPIELTPAKGNRIWREVEI